MEQKSFLSGVNTSITVAAFLLLAAVIFSGCSLNSSTTIDSGDSANSNQEGQMMNDDNAMMEENGDRDDAMMEGDQEGSMMEDKDNGAMMEGDEEGMVMVNSDGSVSVEVGASASAEVKVFDVSGKNFAFMMNGEENPDIRVKEGDRVKIVFTSESGFHDWVVDEFDAATAKVQTNGVTEVEFVADKKGTFEYYCSVGSHRANGMKGNLIVE